MLRWHHCGLNDQARPNPGTEAVDWMDAFGEDAGKTLLAIYRLEGDRLVFNRPAISGRWLLILLASSRL